MRLAIALCLALASPLVAQEMTVDERDAFRAEVRAYLLENPEVIMEAIAVLQEREDQLAAQGDLQLVAANSEALFNDPTSFVGGNPDGDITIVEFLDYRCGYCKRAHPEVAQLLQGDGNIRYVVKELPILGEASVLASRYALAVKLTAGDEAYEAVHNTLMALRGEVNDENLSRLTNQLGLDGNAIEIAMGSSEIDDILNRNRQLAQAMQINGTPTFVVENQLLRGYLPLDQMQLVIDEVRG